MRRWSLLVAVLLTATLVGAAWSQPMTPGGNRSKNLHFYYTGDDKLNSNFARLDELLGYLIDPDHPTANLPSIFHYDSVNERMGLWDALHPAYTWDLTQSPGNNLLANALRNTGTSGSNTAFIAQGAGTLSFRTQSLDGTNGWFLGQQAGAGQKFCLGPGNVMPTLGQAALCMNTDLSVDAHTINATTINATNISATTLILNGASLTRYYATVAIGSPTIVQENRCVTLSPVTVTGAAAYDFVTLATGTASHTITGDAHSSAGMVYQSWVSAPNTVSIMACCIPIRTGFADPTPATCTGPATSLKVMVEHVS
jgi:hypothetical protein